MLIPVYQTERRYVSEDCTLNTRRCENFKSHTAQLGLVGLRFSNRRDWIIGIIRYKLHQKFSGCGTCSGRDIEIHTAVVADPADSHYNTSVEDRFKTCKHDGRGTNALATPYGPCGLVVLTTKNCKEQFPSTFDLGKSIHELHTYSLAKSWADLEWLAIGQTFWRAQQRKQVQSVSCYSSNIDCFTFETKHYILNLFVIF
jgi:hypothetical protein